MINLKFYTGNDSYSDGDVEDEILEIFKNERDIESVLNCDKRWPIHYHLSPERRNLLEWYPFDKESSLLEIGAGCGALTGLFCEKCASVTAVELSKRRAMIIEARHVRLKNLEIFAGNLNDMKFDRKFDFITLIGVLEYASSFLKSENPHLDFLKNIKELLSPKGRLVIAIENQFGLKYFAGADEDHYGTPFVGLDAYLGQEGRRTFGKSTLSDLITHSGLKPLEFYYPYPDYKFPSYVYSDSCLPNVKDLSPATPTFDNPRQVMFNEQLAFSEIIDNKMFDFFSNSFLVFTENSGKDLS